MKKEHFLASAALFVMLAEPALAGPFIQAQARAGKTAYIEYCVNCHKADLLGSNTAPPIAGPDFLKVWGSKTVASFYKTVHDIMPAYAPGALDETTYIDIVSYILAKNGAKPGNQPFTPKANGTVSGVTGH